MKLRIHYHSDCPFFAGCENMLLNFFNSKEFRQEYEISFSYRYTARYDEGFRQRLKEQLSVYPQHFPDPEDFRHSFGSLPLFFDRIIGVVTSLAITFPLLVVQVIMLYRLLRRVKPDALHINNGGYPAALSARAAAIAGKLAGVPKVLMIVNNMAIDYSRWLRRFEYLIDRTVVSCVDQFVTGSRAAALRLAGVLKLPDRQFISIHNGIAMRKSTESVDEVRHRLGLDGFEGVVFGVVALLIPRKGHGVLLEAVKSIVEALGQTGKLMKVMIEGDGPLREELIEFVEQHDLKSVVCFIGTEANVVNFMAALDVLILPSVKDEDFPNVVLEAMALGKPVIASLLAGTPEQVVDGKSGILVKPQDVYGLADAMKLIVNDHAVMISMGQEAIRRFETCFTASVALDNYRNMYQKLIEDSRENHA